MRLLLALIFLLMLVLHGGHLDAAEWSCDVTNAQSCTGIRCETTSEPVQTSISVDSRTNRAQYCIQTACWGGSIRLSERNGMMIGGGVLRVTDRQNPVAMRAFAASFAVDVRNGDFSTSWTDRAGSQVLFWGHCTQVAPSARRPAAGPSSTR